MKERGCGRSKKRLQAAIDAAHKACVEKWEHERADAATVYQIDIPAQHLTVRSGAYAREVLLTLRGVGVGGTYRVTTE